MTDKESTCRLPLSHLLLDLILPVEKTPTALALRKKIRKTGHPSIVIKTTDDNQLAFFLRDGRIFVSEANLTVPIRRTPFTQRSLRKKDLFLVRKTFSLEV